MTLGTAGTTHPPDAAIPPLPAADDAPDRGRIRPNHHRRPHQRRRAPRRPAAPIPDGSGGASPEGHSMRYNPQTSLLAGMDTSVLQQR
jgi:hypothetical protein